MTTPSATRRAGTLSGNLPATALAKKITSLTGRLLEDRGEVGEEGDGRGGIALATHL
jgi:hypothetical protein